MRLFLGLYLKSLLIALLGLACIGSIKAGSNKSFHFIQLPFEGLSHHTVNSIFQDADGFLWFGTINGLNRYDGLGYKVYHAGNGSKLNLSNDYINSIHQDKTGNMWVGTKYGLNVLMGSGNYFRKYLPDNTNPNSIGNTNIEVIYRDSQDRMWIGTWGGLSLYREKTDDFENYKHNPADENSISGDVVTSILEDSKGRLWIGTAFSGLNLLDIASGKFQRFQQNAAQKNCISGNSISAIYEDEKGTIWVGAEQGGLNRFEEKSQTFKWYLNEEKSTSIASNTVYSIIEDENGELMVGGMNGGISIYNGIEDNFSRYDTYGNYNPFGSKASVFCHYKLKTGEIVIATSNGGVKIQDNYPTAIEMIRHIDGNHQSMPMNNVSALCWDTNENLWLGTAGGGLAYMDTRTKKFKQFPVFKDKTINSLLMDNQGTLWIGTLENGLAKYSGADQKFSYYKHQPGNQNSIHSDLVTQITQTENGIWLGSEDGIDFFDHSSRSFAHYSHTYSSGRKIPIGKVSGLLIDYTYKLLVASESGLHVYDEKQQVFNTIPFGQSGKPQWVSYFYEDSKQYIWASSLNGNLELLDFNRKPVPYIISNNNNPISKVTNIIEDANGSYWITCSQGLIKCQVDHEGGTIRVLNVFNENDGLQGDVFNPYSAILSKKNGEILLGGLNGLNIFNPDEMNANPHVPPVVLTDIKLNGKTYKSPEDQSLMETASISVPKKDASTIDIQYSALNYVKAQKNQYAFMLEGHDQNWQYTGNKGLASYANLPPGNYKLKVKGANNDGVWNHHGPTLNINIIPTIWETTTFRLGMLGLLLTLATLGFIGYKKISDRQEPGSALADLLNQNHKPSDGDLLSKDSQDKDFIEKAIAYVESNIGNEELSISTMCTELGLSRAKLFRKIKELTGQTVSNFIKDIRLEKARIYLDSNPRSVSEVAYKIGFKSHSHFTRSFKDKFGISPSSYVQD